MAKINRTMVYNVAIKQFRNLGRDSDGKWRYENALNKTCFDLFGKQGIGTKLSPKSKVGRIEKCISTFDSVPSSSKYKYLAVASSADMVKLGEWVNSGSDLEGITITLADDLDLTGCADFDCMGVTKADSTGDIQGNASEVCRAYESYRFPALGCHAVHTAKSERWL